MIAQLPLREGGAEDVLGNRPAALGILRADPDIVVEAEARMPPPEELADNPSINPPLPEEHPEHPVPEKLFHSVNNVPH